jgi:shikimate kinase
MKRASNIVLVGFMGTGKSVVGQRLARRLDKSFIDTDIRIAEAAGCSVPIIFRTEGELSFRDRETELLRTLVGSTNSVVATGGGIVGRDENVELLRQVGPLICLTARPDIILERTRPWEERPLLAGSPDPRETVERLLTDRAPRYALADWAVDTSDRTVEEVVEEICRVLP